MGVFNSKCVILPVCHEVFKCPFLILQKPVWVKQGSSQNIELATLSSDFKHL